MAPWIERYKAGEHAEVWAEMQAMGDDILKPAHRKAAAPVTRETMNRASRNVNRLFEDLLSLGYRFQGTAEPGEPDYPLELRIEHAMEYAKTHGGPQYKKDPWTHPALAWVDEEDIEVPARFRNGKPGRSSYRPPGARTLAALGSSPLPLAVRAWFEQVGCVNLAGTHPLLNPGGTIGVLCVTPEDIDRTARPGAGADFVAKVRHAFEWCGFLGWDGRADPPERELDWLRPRLVAL